MRTSAATAAAAADADEGGGGGGRGRGRRRTTHADGSPSDSIIEEAVLLTDLSGFQETYMLFIPLSVHHDFTLSTAQTPREDYASALLTPRVYGSAASLHRCPCRSRVLLQPSAPHSTAAPARAEFFSSRRRRTPPLPRRSRGLPQPPPEPETTLDGTEVVPSRHRTPPQPAPTGTMVVPSSAGPVPGIAPDGAEVIPSRCRTLPQPAPTSHEVCPYRCQSPSAANHIRIPPQHAPAGAEVVPPSAGATPGTSPSEAEVVPPSTGGWSCVWACPSGAEVVPRPPLPPTFFCYLFPKVRYAGIVDAR
ncbi:hypothetical protein OsI_12716 [Oryza sativa Indica Group]|uniref:Uncharacterized protein n=1 Tax=Oryza sativa subsp. indica TaxID=39946 RepID=B8AN17_ORYSI|nr:hypothetical protein OsI_12716 [Oryza sativa Indica Group]